MIFVASLEQNGSVWDARDGSAWTEKSVKRMPQTRLCPFTAKSIRGSNCASKRLVIIKPTRKPGAEWEINLNEHDARRDERIPIANVYSLG